jgi:alanine racemase
VLHQEQLARELQNDWVRPGIMLYGGTPGGKSAAEYGLRPAMTLSSEIIGIQQLQAGDSVGYGSRFEATGPMTVGVVACGYADGYPRHAPHGTPVLVDGVRTSLIGRVSMDMMTVDLTPVANARVGSKVTLWGDGLPIDEVAHAAGTIGYELMCAVAPRVRMVEGRLGTHG